MSTNFVFKYTLYKFWLIINASWPKIQHVFDMEKEYCMLVYAKSQLVSLICLASLTIDYMVYSSVIVFYNSQLWEL